MAANRDVSSCVANNLIHRLCEIDEKEQGVQAARQGVARTKLDKAAPSLVAEWILMYLGLDDQPIFFQFSILENKLPVHPAKKIIKFVCLLV